MNPHLSSATEPFRQTLISASQGVHEDSWEIGSRSRKARFRGENAPVADWSVRKTTLHGGKQEGVDLIEVDNGRLKLTVIPTRGMGVLRVESGDVRLGWDSPVKEVVHPQFINLQSRDGLGWLEGFNEWMVRCGLESAGHPGTDTFINNVGDEAEMELTLHGKVANIPASEVEVVIDREEPFRIRIRGRVDERMFYGPKLELWTEISTVPGTGTFRIEDTLINRGAYDQEFQLIYHCNFGPPLLEAGSRFLGTVEQVIPFNAHAATGLAAYAEYGGPVKGFVEQVYCMVPRPDGEGRGHFMLRNQDGSRGVTMSFPVEQLPSFTLWKNTNAEAEGYVTGLEPGTGFPANRSVERKAGRVPKLAPGQSRRFQIEFIIQDSAEAVDVMTRLIRDVQGGKEPVLASDRKVVE